jgi:hypothetical protein
MADAGICTALLEMFAIILNFRCFFRECKDSIFFNESVFEFIIFASCFETLDKIRWQHSDKGL